MRQDEERSKFPRAQSDGRRGMEVWEEGRIREVHRAIEHRMEAQRADADHPFRDSIAAQEIAPPRRPAAAQPRSRKSGVRSRTIIFDLLLPGVEGSATLLSPRSRVER